MKLHRIFSLLVILVLLYSCSNNEDNVEEPNESSQLVGIWQKISGEDQDGDIIDYTSTCYTIEFTETQFFLTDYLDANCTEVFIKDQGFIYSKVDNFIYWGEISQDIKDEIINLSETTLIIKGEDYDNNGVYFSTILTFRRI